MKSKLFQILLPAILTVFLFFLLIRLYKNNEAELYSGNPVFEGWYADPEVALIDSTCWIFPTYSDRYNKQVFLDAFSSQNLINWQKHERILDTSIITWADSALWAPCLIEKDDRFYLFFSANDIQSAERIGIVNKDNEFTPSIGGIGVAVSNHPGGPYKDYLGKPLINEFYNGAQPIDQFIYHENGQYYILYGGWGVCNIARLNDSFTSLLPFENGQKVKNITPEGYVEGPYMFKKNGLYYLMWSEGGWTNESYQVAYGTSESLVGPFKKQGVILKKDSLATGAGHHSVMNIPGTDDWYMIYHRRPIPNQGRDHRVVCIDRMYFGENGEILPVKMTNEGVLARPLIR